MMLINEVEKRNDNLKKLKIKREHEKELRKQKRQNDLFKSNCEKVQNITELLQIYKKEFDYKISIETIREFKQALLQVSEYIKENNIDEDHNKLLNDVLGKINDELKYGWGQFYFDNTNNTVNLLNMISAINKQEVEDCLRQIKKYNKVITNPNELIRFKKQLDRAKGIIEHLDMDEEIISFLQKVNEGCATLVDLNKDVLNWIKKEKLENKIKLNM